MAVLSAMGTGVRAGSAMLGFRCKYGICCMETAFGYTYWEHKGGMATGYIVHDLVRAHGDGSKMSDTRRLVAFVRLIGS